MRALVKGWENSRVLKELHQNSSMLENKQGDEYTKGGTWKRRTLASNSNGIMEGDKDQVKAGKRSVNSGKMDFYLLDEKEALDEDTLTGKK